MEASSKPVSIDYETNVAALLTPEPDLPCIGYGIEAFDHEVELLQFLPTQPVRGREQHLEVWLILDIRMSVSSEVECRIRVRQH